MGAGSVLTLGYAPSGSLARVLTLGYGFGARVAPPVRPQFPAGFTAPPERKRLEIIRVPLVRVSAAALIRVSGRVAREETPTAEVLAALTDALFND